MTDTFNVLDYERLSQDKLPKALFEYIRSGTADEVTLKENRTAFQRWFLRPRVLRPVSSLSTATTILGINVDMPVFCSPAGVQALCHSQGECATARAAHRTGILFGLSQHATRSIEQVVAAAPKGPKWYQSYILKDRPLTLRLVRRAIAAGYQGMYAHIM